VSLERGGQGRGEERRGEKLKTLTGRRWWVALRGDFAGWTNQEKSLSLERASFVLSGPNKRLM
jgi:hypothetical protein